MEEKQEHPPSILKHVYLMDRQAAKNLSDSSRCLQPWQRCGRQVQQCQQPVPRDESSTSQQLKVMNHDTLVWTSKIQVELGSMMWCSSCSCWQKLHCEVIQHLFIPRGKVTGNSKGCIGANCATWWEKCSKDSSSLEKRCEANKQTRKLRRDKWKVHSYFT